MGRLNGIIFIIAVNVVGHVIARDTILVTDLYNGKIWEAPLDTLDFKALPLQNIGTPVAVDFDPDELKVYWSDIAYKTISRAKLDGTEQQVIVAYLSNPEGIAIDAVNRHVYWTDTGTNRTERANLDGSGRQVIVQEGHDKPRAIVVDSAGGRLYWTDWGAKPKIERSNLDGSERKVLVNTSLEQPNGLALDLQGNRLYWCDSGLDTIETTDLDGGDRKNLFTLPPTLDIPDIRPFDIGIYDEYIYWSDLFLTKVVRLNKYVGRQATAVGSGVFEGGAGGLHIVKDTTNECLSNPCQNGGICHDEIDNYQCNCTGTGYQDQGCQTDVNDCLQTPPVCEDGVCINTIGSYKCECLSGFEEQGQTCTDVNECLQTPSVCHEDADCTNGPGSFVCKCKPGFSGDGINTCIDIDVCRSFPCENGGQCVDMVGLIFVCNCPDGYYGDICQYLSDGCKYPGDIANGYVIPPPGHVGDVYEPGEKVDFACSDGYMPGGGLEAFCQIDGTWSDENPVCESEDDGFVLSNVAVIGGGAGGGVLILVLIIILIVVCCKKRRRPAGTGGELPGLAVVYRGQPPTVPKENKEEAIYNTAFDHVPEQRYAPRRNANSPTTGTTDTLSHRTPAPLPSQYRVPRSNNFNDDLNQPDAGATWPNASAHPPSYISVIGNTDGDNNGYSIMKPGVNAP